MSTPGGASPTPGDKAAEPAVASGAGEAHFTVRAHHEHPGHDRHRLGHPVDEQVKSMAHLYKRWSNLRANGSGLVAFVAWMHYLEGRAEQGAEVAVQRVRGLTHR